METPDGAYIAETGHDYCATLAATADANSQASMAGGIALAIPALAAVIVGLVIGPDVGENKSWIERNRNTVIVSAGGLLAIPATLLLTHSRASSGASAQAAESMLLPDAEAKTACLKVRSTILSARAEIASTVQSELDRRVQAANSALAHAKARIEDLRKKQAEALAERERISNELARAQREKDDALRTLSSLSQKADADRDRLKKEMEDKLTEATARESSLRSQLNSQAQILNKIASEVSAVQAYETRANESLLETLVNKAKQADAEREP